MTCTSIAVLALAACDPSGSVMELRPSLSGGAQVGGCELVSLGHLWPNAQRWTCAASAVEVGSPPELRAAVIFAAAEWNIAAGHSADGSVQSPWAPGFPRLIPRADTLGDLNVRWGTGGGALFCGQTVADSDFVYVHRAGAVGSAGACHSNATTDPNVLLVHEFGHASGSITTCTRVQTTPLAAR
jgi:hypothetical protein